MDDAVVAAAQEGAAITTSTRFYSEDLVSYQSVRGLASQTDWAWSPADEFAMLCADGTIVTKKAGDTDVTLLDRSNLHAGQIVVSASDVKGGNIGVVTGVNTVVDLVQYNDSGEAATEVLRGVSPSDLQRVRPLSIGDYVVSGTWLGRVVEVTLDVDIMFDHGTVCRVTDAESKFADDPPFSYSKQANAGFYPGMGIVKTSASAFFRGERWSKGNHKIEGEVGTVARVEMSGVVVLWIASAHCGADQQLVQESAPPEYQDPANLTYFCSDSSCIWAAADRCFLRESASASSGTDAGEERDDSSSSSSQSGGTPTTMTVCNTHTTVDVLWQDGTRQHGAPSTSLAPFGYMNKHEVFPGQYVVDAAVTEEDDDVVSVATGSTRRVGVVKSVNSQDHTVNVSWFKAASSLPDDAANRWEADCDATVSAYDLDTDPDHCVFYGDIVVRLQPNDGQSTPEAQQPLAPCNHKKTAPADLSLVGRVVDLHDGHVQVRWGDGSTSTVSPHEISVANKEHFMDLQALMGDWVEEDDASQEFGSDNTDNDLHDPADATDVEGGIVEGSQTSRNELDGEEEEDDDDASQEFGSDKRDNDLDDPTDAINVEGHKVEGSQTSGNELDGLATTRTGWLGGFIRSMIRAVAQVLARGKWYYVNWSRETTRIVEVREHVPTGTHQDPSITGAEAEATFAPLSRSDASVDEDDSAKYVVKVREANGDEDPSNFPHFDVVQSPPDHHFLESMDQGGNGGKAWVKAVQKEWNILENSLPDTICMRAYEDRMDLLRAVMVGASGTPYQDGLFFFDLQLPPSYPDVPPQVYYHSFGLRLNPNLNESGTVCLSLLDTFGGEGTELWSPGTSSLLQVVVSIQALVLNDQPFYNEDGYDALVDKPEGHRNATSYIENAYLLTLRNALNLLRRPPKGFEEFVKDHFRRRGRYVLGTCEAYQRGCVPAEQGGMELPCSAGFRSSLGKIVPRLNDAFTEIGAEGCDRCPLATDQQMEAAVAVLT